MIINHYRKFYLTKLIFKKMGSLFVGITGPSCSGKTSLIKKVAEKIGNANLEIILKIINSLTYIFN